MNRLIRLKNGQTITSFGKYCYDRSLCSVEDCKRDDPEHVSGTWCEIDCCDVTLCNTGATKKLSQAQRYQFSGILLGTCSFIVLLFTTRSMNIFWVSQLEFFFFFLLLTYIIGIKIFYIETSSKLQWNLPERPPLSRDHLTKLPTGTSVTQIAISETSRKRPQLSLTSRVVA